VEIAGDNVDQNCDTDELCFTDADNDGARLTTTFTSTDTDCNDANEGVAGDAIDCNDAQSAVRPGAVEVAGDNVDQNCDTDELCFTDADNDGARLTTTVLSTDTDCNDANEGVTADAIDCNDTLAAVRPGAVEVPADGVDQNCDTDELCYTDADNDGARLTSTVLSTDLDCNDANEGVTADAIDCNDADGAIRPAAVELPGDNVDQNCDTDELCYTDADNDGARLTTTVVSTDTDCNDANEGVTADAIDCNDADGAIRPDAQELPGDNIDQNCNILELCYVDGDNDGARLTTTVNSPDSDCNDANEGVTGDAIDCDDGDNAIRPGAVELAGDNVDQDCDTDELCYTDADNDGARLGTTVVSTDADCNDANEGVTADDLDCDDTRADTFPDAAEVPGDGVDQDCSGIEDCFVDSDGDDAHTTVVDAGGTNDDLDCDDAGEGRADEAIDCDDNEAAVNPGELETTCNGRDDDCSAATPDDADADADGVGQCTDCDDADADNFPGNPEVCDGADNDCMFGSDDGLAFALWYEDADEDTFGDPYTAYSTCSGPPAGAVGDDTDCDDTRAEVNPDGTEVDCNGLDDDCAPATLDGPDLDGDGYAGCGGDCDDGDELVNPGAAEALCNKVDDDCDPRTTDDEDRDQDAFSACGGDCDDGDDAVNPDGAEVACNGADDDCTPGTPDDVDADSDGWTGCDEDCDDADETIAPDATELSCDGVDNDCDPRTPDDEDRDGDGLDVCAGDCDDTEANVPGQTELPCNDIDDDCDPDTLDCPGTGDTAGPSTDKVPLVDPGCGCDHGRPTTAWAAVGGLLWLLRRRRVSSRARHT
jgi:hypothetical protein